LIRENSGGIDAARFVSMGDEIVRALIETGGLKRDGGSGRWLRSRQNRKATSCVPFARGFLSRHRYQSAGHRLVRNCLQGSIQFYVSLRRSFQQQVSRYRKEGKSSAAKYTYPLPNSNFDIVCGLSLWFRPV
jgi:hypothetical protein